MTINVGKVWGTFDYQDDAERTTTPIILNHWLLLMGANGNCCGSNLALPVVSLDHLNLAPPTLPPVKQQQKVR